MTDLTMEEIARLSWDAMDEEQRKLITEVQNIKRMCMSRVESLFVQRYHDVGDELYDLVDEVNNTNDLDAKIDEIIDGL